MPNGVIQRGGTPITSTSDLGLYSQAAGNYIRVVASDAPIRFYTDGHQTPQGGSPRMTIESNGNVGIGTTAPEARLHVEGNARVNGALRINLMPSASWTYGQVINLSSGAAGVLNETKVFALHRHDQPGDIVTIMGDGTVLAQRVVAAGYVCADEMRVRLDPTSDCWPDYVFDPSYELLPLDSLGTFVETQRHLPGIPSAGEVAQQGSVEVGQMNIRLLEKVEELTLYILELNRANEELRRRVEALEQLSGSR